MPKKILCSCEQGYHYSHAERTKCLNKRGQIQLSTINQQFSRQIKSINLRSHACVCQCEQCEAIRVQKLILFFQPSFNRLILLSQSDESEGQAPKMGNISDLPLQKIERTGQWNFEKINQLMNIGVGNLHSWYFQAIKNKRRRMRRSSIFIRMFMFLNPQTSIIVSNWSKIVKPRQLMLQDSRPIDNRSYKQRIENRLDILAKKYKESYTNSKMFHVRTRKMIQIQEKIEQLSSIMERFYFIEQFQSLLAEKQLQQWEKNMIVVLKKGEYHPHMIKSFNDLKEIAPFLQVPSPKKSDVNRISQRRQLDRRYEQVRKKAEQQKLLKKAKDSDQLWLLEELSFNQSRYGSQKMMMMELSLTRPAKNIQKMEIEYSLPVNQTNTFSKSQLKIVKQSLGRSYLSPRIIVKGSSKPLSKEQIQSQVGMYMSQSHRKDKFIACQTQVSSLRAFSQNKSIAGSQYFSEELSPFIQRQIIPQSDLSVYGIMDINQFPKKKLGFNSSDFQKCSKQNCQKWLVGSVLECKKCNSLFHNACWSQNFCNICSSLKHDLTFSFTIFSNDEFKQGKKVIKYPQQILSQEETLDVIDKMEKHILPRTYCITNCFSEQFKIYPFYNSQLKRLHQTDELIIDQFYNRRIAFPTRVQFINKKKGNGLVANRHIFKGELVSTYSGNVISLAQVSKYEREGLQKYIFQLISGPDAQSNFVVFPKDFASPGFFMNHSTAESSINVQTLIVLSKHGPLILMLASRKIAEGEELLYDYNGEYDLFDTKNFQ